MIGGRLLRAAARCAALGAAAHAAAPPPTRPERASLPPATPPAAPSLREHGLLAGVSEPGAAAFFSSHLPDLRAAGALLTSRGLLWAAAQSDAAALGVTAEAYVADVGRAAADYIRRNELYDRVDTMRALGAIMGEGEGEFALFVGAADLGKSFMLRELATRLRAQRRRVLIVNARDTGSDLVEGILAGTKGDLGFVELLLRSLPQRAQAAAAAVANVRLPGLGPAVSAALAPPPSERQTNEALDVLRGFVSACEMEGRFPVLIIDEANRALPSAKVDKDARKSPPDEETERRTLQVLDLLTQLTKESRRMNVLLTASEHAEPFRLALLGFGTHHMTSTVVACEVPPAETHALLTREWRCGPALAEGLMAVYGGHVWRLRLAVGGLAHEGPAFRAVSGFPTAVSDGVNKCVRAARSEDKAMAGFDSMLRAVATRGYAEVSSRDDPRAELASKLNVGGLVPDVALAPGLPPEAWSEAASTQLLVAASHGSRLLLARELAREDATH